MQLSENTPFHLAPELLEIRPLTPRFQNCGFYCPYRSAIRDRWELIGRCLDQKLPGSIIASSNE
jgi:hypothetical protein